LKSTCQKGAKGSSISDAIVDVFGETLLKHGKRGAHRIINWLNGTVKRPLARD
jgi:hypothetical protein